MNDRGTLAYLSHYFPTLTQTFVYREIFALEALGWKVKPFAIRRPTKGIHEEAREIAERTTYLVPVPPLSFLARQVGLFLRRPVRYLGLLLFLLTRPGETMRSRLHALTHFFGGIHLVPEIRASGARHIHAHFGRNPATLALVAAGYMDIPFSMTVHARDLFVDAALFSTKIERAKFIATVSEYNRRILETYASTPRAAEKIHVVHCGIDPQRFAPPAGEERSEGEPARRPLFVAVGRLVPKKGYRYLVEAAAILKDRGVPFEIRVVGGGPERDELEARCIELGLQGSVQLEGPLPQEAIPALLRRADAFVLPCVQAPDGDQDGIPVSLMEAMACEVPCVSTKISGIPELIQDGQEGLLVAEKSPEELADALELLALNPERGRLVGRAAREKVEREFALDAQARALDRLFRQ